MFADILHSVIKQIKLPNTVRMKSWKYWRDNDGQYATYEGWARNEYKINVITSWNNFTSFSRTIEGDEKDLTYFLLRWS